MKLDQTASFWGDFYQRTIMILSRLRAETRLAHERIEAHIDLLGRAWSLPLYQALLQKFTGFYVEIEPPIFEHSEWQHLGINVQKRRKTRFLVRDLEFLGLSSRAIDNLPRCQKLPRAATFVQALGCAYVLEGSTLGGQVITRHLRRELGTGIEGASAFFGSYGAEVGPMWREFVAVLERFPLDEAQQNALVRSACDTFESLDEWLCDVL